VPLVVHAGDSISVSIQEQSPDVWQVSLTNNTTGQNYQVGAQYRSSHSSAEWIEEAPSAGRGGILPLDAFGVVTFSDASAMVGDQSLNLAQVNAQPIELQSPGGQPLVTVSGLGEDASSFTATRTSTADTVPQGRSTRSR
jgi:hypothetical protein